MYDIMPHGRPARRRALAEFHVKRMVLSPYQWAACQLALDLDWEAVKFTPRNMRRVPKTRGVYTFLVQPGIANHPSCSYLLYLGETQDQDFRKRYQQYLREKRNSDKSARPHVADMLQKWDGFLWFCYARIDQDNIIEDIENTLLTAYLPPTNKDFPANVSRALRRLFGT